MAMSSKEKYPQVGPDNRESHPASAGRLDGYGGGTETSTMSTCPVEAQAGKFDTATGYTTDHAMDTEFGVTEKIVRESTVTKVGSSKEQERAWFEGVMQKMKQGNIKLKKLDVEGKRTESAPVSPATNIGMFDLTWNEEEARSVKRRRTDTELEEDIMSGEGRLATKIRKALVSIDEEIRKIARIARERNVRKEVKEGVVKLRSLMSIITTDESSALLQRLGRNVTDGGVETQEICTRDMTTQTEAVEGEGDEIVAEELNEKIDKVRDYEGYCQVKGINWPESCFCKVKISLGDPLDVNPNADLVVIREPDDTELEKEWYKNIKSRYPELSKMGKNGWETYINSVKKVNVTGTWSESEKYVHIGCGGDEESTFEALKGLVNHLKSLERVHAVVGGSELLDEVNIAKMLECLLRGENINIEVYRRRRKTRRGDSRLEGRKREYKNQAIVVSREGWSYKEVLKKVKEEVQGTNVEVDLAGVRKTKKGELLLEMKDNETGDKIKEILDVKLKDMKFRELGKVDTDRQRYIVTDIDGLCSEKEVLESIRSTAREMDRRDGVEMMALGESYGGCQYAKIKMDKAWGDRLMDEGGVKIGLVRCKMKKWIEVQRCYKCWGYEHEAKSCRGPDRSKACLRCGGEGHKAGECERSSFCPLCEREGHRAGSGACPCMRRMLAKLRKKQKK